MCKLFKRRTLSKKKNRFKLFFRGITQRFMVFYGGKGFFYLDKTHNRRVSTHHNSRVEDLHLRREF